MGIDRHSVRNRVKHLVRKKKEAWTKKKEESEEKQSKGIFSRLFWRKKEDTTTPTNRATEASDFDYESFNEEESEALNLSVI